MKVWELKEFVKSEESKRQFERHQECTRLSSDAIADRFFALAVPVPEAPGLRDVGSCALLKIKNRLFVVTAGHVLDLALKLNKEDIVLFGKNVFTFISRNGIRRADDMIVDGVKVTIDAAVFELTGPIPEHLLRNAFTEDMLSEPTFSEWHLIAGYPFYLATRSRNTLNLNPTMAPLSLYGERHVTGERIRYKFDDSHVTNISYGFVNYGMKIENGRIYKLPPLKGMSGGPLIRMTGIPGDPDFPITDPTAMSLTAIAVENEGRKYDVPPLIVATNIRVHLALINSIISRIDDIDYRWRIMKNMR